jgi:CheY-like chemotaxis protein
MIEDGTYNIILMDLRMPGMDGLTAIQKIRSRPDAKARIPVIVVTADTAIDLRTRCLDDGADDVILKPVAMGMLLKSISCLVAKSAKAGGLVVN